MKKFFKKLRIFLSVVLSIFSFMYFRSGSACLAANVSEAKTEEQKEDFNFIKSNDGVADFIYDGTVLLYGGIALVAISVAGMILTVLKKPKRR